jgi:hypothetical protein
MNRDDGDVKVAKEDYAAIMTGCKSRRCNVTEMMDVTELPFGSEMQSKMVRRSP